MLHSLCNNLTNIALTFKLTQIHVLGRHVVSYRSTVATGVWILILLRSAAAFYITFSLYCSNNLEGKNKKQHSVKINFGAQVSE